MHIILHFKKNIGLQIFSEVAIVFHIFTKAFRAYFRLGQVRGLDCPEGFKPPTGG